MSENDFWDRIKHGCERLEIPLSNLHVWKARGRVAAEQRIPLYQVLAGTEREVSLDQIQAKHKAEPSRNAPA